MAKNKETVESIATSRQQYVKAESELSELDRKMGRLKTHRDKVNRMLLLLELKMEALLKIGEQPVDRKSVV